MFSGTKEPHIAMLEFMAELTKRVQEINPVLKPVVVGGSAVWIYSDGDHLTKDIDLVVEDRQVVKDVLLELGFKQSESIRHWYHDDRDIVIEIPDDTLAGDMDKVTIVPVKGIDVYIIGVEDLLIDRLCAAKHWGSDRDEYQSIFLLSFYEDEMDWAYLKKRATEEQVSDLLENLKNKLAD